MDTHDLIQPLIDLGKYLEEAEEQCSFANKEIQYWRERYLQRLPKYENPHQDAFIRNAFMYLPSQQFLVSTPEAYIKLLETHYES